jgi:hypothetical protein
MTAAAQINVGKYIYRSDVRFVFEHFGRRKPFRGLPYGQKIAIKIPRKSILRHCRSVTSAARDMTGILQMEFPNVLSVSFLYSTRALIVQSGPLTWLLVL